MTTTLAFAGHPVGAPSAAAGDEPRGRDRIRVPVPPGGRDALREERAHPARARRRGRFDRALPDRGLLVRAAGGEPRPDRRAARERPRRRGDARVRLARRLRRRHADEPLRVGDRPRRDGGDVPRDDGHRPAHDGHVAVHPRRSADELRGPAPAQARLRLPGSARDRLALPTIATVPPSRMPAPGTSPAGARFSSRTRRARRATWERPRWRAATTGGGTTSS